MRNVSLVTLGLLVLSSPSMADEAFTIKAKVIGAESKLDIDQVTASAGNAEIALGTNQEGEAKSLNAIGGGADFEFRVAEPLRLGLGVGYTQFEKDKEALGYSDLALTGYSSYDFLNQEMFALFGKAGLSYHQVDLEDRDLSVGKASYDSTGLLNYNAGLGARFKLNQEMNFGVEYTYTDTFSRNDVDVTHEGLGLVASNVKLKDLSLRKNELVASLGYSF